jgi:hypothetical protein
MIRWNPVGSLVRRTKIPWVSVQSGVENKGRCKSAFAGKTYAAIGAGNQYLARTGRARLGEVC